MNQSQPRRSRAISLRTDAAEPADVSLRVFRTTRIYSEFRPPADETCCICLDSYGRGHSAVRVHFRTCEHIFGRECLDGWLDSGSPMSHCCPICRKKWYTKNFVSRERHNLYAARIRTCLARMRDRISRSMTATFGTTQASVVPTTGILLDREQFVPLAQQLADLENMELRSLSSSASIPQQLRYLGIRLDVLRQNMQDQNDLQERQPLLSTSRSRRNAMAEVGLASSFTAAELSVPQSHSPRQRNTSRDFVDSHTQADDVIDNRRRNFSRPFFVGTLQIPRNEPNPNTTAASSVSTCRSMRDRNTPSPNRDRSDNGLQQHSSPPQDANSLQRLATPFAPSEPTNSDGASSRISVDVAADSPLDFQPIGSMSPDGSLINTMASNSRSNFPELQPSLPEGLPLTISSSYEHSEAWADGLRF
jgi:hypothetical protein